jgi:hypothetical protein
MADPIFTRSREVPRSVRGLPREWRGGDDEVSWPRLIVTSAIISLTGYALFFAYFILTGGK